MTGRTQVETDTLHFSGDIEFLAEHFGKLTDALTHELPSEFVERVRYLTSELTPFPGKFSFDRFPYFRKIVDCFSPLDNTQEIVLMKGNQLGATTAVLETVLLYNIMSDAKAQMYVTADAGLVRTSVQWLVAAGSLSALLDYIATPTSPTAGAKKLPEALCFL